MNSGFGDDVGIETVAEIDRIDVITMVADSVSMGHFHSNDKVAARKPSTLRWIEAARERGVGGGRLSEDKLTIPDRCT